LSAWSGFLPRHGCSPRPSERGVPGCGRDVPKRHEVGLRIPRGEPPPRRVDGQGRSENSWPVPSAHLAELSRFDHDDLIARSKNGEPPVIAEGFDEPLAEGMVLALEPKKGVPGAGLVGTENTYLVTPAGGRSLTGSQPGPILVPA